VGRNKGGINATAAIAFRSRRHDDCFCVGRQVPGGFLAGVLGPNLGCVRLDGRAGCTGWELGGLEAVTLVCAANRTLGLNFVCVG